MSTIDDLAVNYAGAISLEVRELANSTKAYDYYIRFSFKNGTDDADFTAYPMLGREDGQYDVPIADFYDALSVSNAALGNASHVVAVNRKKEPFADIRISLPSSHSHTPYPTLVLGAAFAATPRIEDANKRPSSLRSSIR